MSTNTHFLKTFLAGLRRTRTSHRSSAAATYWRAAAAIAAGVKPKDREEHIIEAMEKLGRDEDALAADAHRITQLMQVERTAAKEADAKTRLKTATIAQAAADRRAAELLREADRIRAEVQAATTEARNEVDIARGATQRADALRLELARLGHPEHAGEGDRVARQREVERLEADLRALEPEVREAVAAAEALPVVEDRATEGAAARTRGRALLLTQKLDRLSSRLESLKAGGPIDGDIDEDGTDDFEPVADEAVTS